MNGCTPIFILMKNYFLLLARRLCLSLSARAHDAKVDGIFYNLDKANKTATVTFKGDDPYSYNEYSGDVVIPETVTYNGITYSVTRLGDYCFLGCSSLTSITMLPSTPPSTGDWIFDGSPLETVYVVDEYAKTAYQTQEPWNQYAIVVMPTDIEELKTDKTTPTIVGYYDLSGRPINGKQRGAVILRYSDGTTRKVLVK